MLTSSGFLLGMNNHGLFSCASYIASISGGSWTVMRLLLADFDVDKLRNWDIKNSLLEGVPNFEFKNRDIVQQLDGTAEAHEFFMDDGFYNELKEHVSKWKREFAEPVDSVDPTFNEFHDSLESNWMRLNHNAIQKRSLDTFLKLKETIEELFKGNNDSSPTNQIKKLEEMMDTFSNFRKVLGFYIMLHSEVRPKKIMGFPVSFTDYWGRALWKKISYQETKTNSMSELFVQSPSASNYEAPLPIIIANCKNEDLVNVVFEFTPFEFGSWNKLLRLFVKLRYLGSTVSRGIARSCIQGFDDVGFITATSSSLFNNVLIYAWQLAADSSQKTMKAVRALFSTFGVNLKNKNSEGKIFGTRSDFALFQPNPFYQYPGIETPLTKTDKLYLVDGGEDGENIPLRPFLQPERKVDLIFALDSSSGKINYPTGSILRNLYDNMRQSEDSISILSPNGTPVNVDPMPYIPLPEEFERSKLLNHPIAFGCYQSSYRKRTSSVLLPPGKLPPIILYHANRNHTYQSNTSTFKLNYSPKEVDGMLNNGWNIFTDNNNTSYLQCIGCLMIKRTYDNTASTELLPPTCHSCFKKYCYN
ncbi:putative carboxylic ester hydrolase Ecym_1311 [Eremothecium cymbalariae DBVPG|uniref:Lysophospholipase n=1 Tax=Eremothecium cymbalariae (strain CBS 270.75 / DBVPG 7215 / KCTC 17166 / NRRL Y-17582) TaxID=931890 RepID=G8JN85_ERECY|nr:hypothetical protein Ecym_1311 [Eremothecium cymbalariae DBVPG\